MSALAARAREATGGVFATRVVRQPVAEAFSPSSSGWDRVAVGARVAFCYPRGNRKGQRREATVLCYGLTQSGSRTVRVFDERCARPVNTSWSSPATSWCSLGAELGVQLLRDQH